jgi:hypothetical protein
MTTLRWLLSTCVAAATVSCFLYSGSFSRSMRVSPQNGAVEASLPGVSVGPAGAASEEDLRDNSTRRTGTVEELGKSPLSFERNNGQAGSEVRFVSHGPGYSLTLSSSEAVLSLSKGDDDRSGLRKPRVPRLYTTAALRMALVGANPRAEITGLDPLPTKINYLLGNNPKDWLLHVPNYARVKYAGVYPGIDLVYYGNQRQLEYDFLVAPGADPRQIRLSFEGVKALRLDSGTGDLLVTTVTGSEVRHRHPLMYQRSGGKEVQISGGYRLLDQRHAAFVVGSYDSRKSLVIDPTVVFTTFLAGSNLDYSTGLAVDSAGNTYVTGYTASSDFPQVGAGPEPVERNCSSAAGSPSAAGAPASSVACDFVAFVTKLSPTGQVLFSTYIGGNGSTFAWGIAVDSSGVYITGGTSATNFFTNAQYAFGSNNAYVAKLVASGEYYYWVTGFGGGTTGESSGNAIALDAQHAAYVTGYTTSVDFPTTEYLPQQRKSWQPVFGGDQDAFVVKVDPYGLLNEGYSTYIGGAGIDIGNAIAVDATGSAYITGTTSSANFPTIGPNSSGSPVGGGATAFVVKLLPDGSGAKYSTFLGGEEDLSNNAPFDGGNGLVVNAIGDAYVTGTTCSTNFPTTAGALQRTQPFPCSSTSPIDKLSKNSGFVTILSPTGRIFYSTYLGGNNFTNAYSIGINGIGQVYIGGVTASTVFLNSRVGFTPNPYAGFLVKLSPTLSGVGITTFLGAQVNRIAVVQPASRFPILNFLDPQIYTTGIRYRPGTDVSDPSNTDVFVVRLSDPILGINL